MHFELTPNVRCNEDYWPGLKIDLGSFFNVDDYWSGVVFFNVKNWDLKSWNLYPAAVSFFNSLIFSNLWSPASVENDNDFKFWTVFELQLALRDSYKSTWNFHTRFHWVLRVVGNFWITKYYNFIDKILNYEKSTGMDCTQ